MLKGFIMNKKHKHFYTFLRPLVILFLKLKFKYKFKTLKQVPDTYIVISNHVTDYDPLFVGASFPKQMYFLASEHITRWKFLYRFLKYVFEPIIRLKGTVASSTVINILKKYVQVIMYVFLRKAFVHGMVSLALFLLLLGN